MTKDEQIWVQGVLQALINAKEVKNDKQMLLDSSRMLLDIWRDISCSNPPVPKVEVFLTEGQMHTYRTPDPHPIERGELSPRQWGTQFVAAINEAQDIDAVDRWCSLNAEQIAGFAAEAPLVFGRITARINERKEALRGTTPANPVIQPIVDLFALCQTKKALDQVWREHVSFKDNLNEAQVAELLTAFRTHEQRVTNLN